MKKYTLMLMLTLFYAFVNLQAQTEAPKKLKVFGLGLNAQQLKLNDASDNIRPVTSAIITVNLFDRLKIEPMFGFAMESVPDSISGSTAYNFGLGIYAMKKRSDNFVIYVGPRVDYSTDEEYYTAGAFNSFFYTTKRLSVGVTLGCEYFFIKNFSIGGELGARLGKVIPPDDTRLPVSLRNNNKIFSYLESGLKLRFYF